MQRTSITNDIQELEHLLARVAKDEAFMDGLAEVTAVISNALKAGKTLLIAGNGGSAADASHFAGELVGRFERERRGYPAVALSADAAVVTAIANDYGFERIFSRQVEALGTEGDVFIGISTSGNSKNILEALRVARAQQLETIAFLGGDGGAACEHAAISLVVPDESTARVQEVHSVLIHALSKHIEQNLSTQ